MATCLYNNQVDSATSGWLGHYNSKCDGFIHKKINHISGDFYSFFFFFFYKRDFYLINSISFFFNTDHVLNTKLFLKKYFNMKP